MRKIQSGLLFVALGLLAGAVDAQEPTRVRGTIAAVEDSVLSVSSAGGGNTAIQLTEKTAIVFSQPIAIGEIKPGDFVGVTSAKGADGTLTAFEIRRFPKPSNPGHRPFQGRDDQTMTNATVSAMVEAASGRELTLTYDGGAQKVLVSEKAAVSTLVPGNRSQLVPGAPVNLTARAGDGGTLTAIGIQVGPPK